MSGPPAGEMTILLVDDDEYLLTGPARVLERAGYRVVAALGGEAALAAIRDRCPHLVLLDWDMRGMDGIEVCRRIKADPAYHHVRVVFFSGVYRRPESQAAAREAGADGYIERPIANRDLVTRIDAIARDLGFEAPARQEDGAAG